MQRVLEVAVVLSAVDRMTRVVNTATANVVTKLQGIENKAKAISSRSFELGRDFGAMGLAVGAALAYPTKQAAEFETGMANVRKVVDGLGDSKALADFGKEIRELSREIPLPITQLQELVAAGGRMGIPRDQLIQYTREVSRMAMAFDAAPGELGEQMGKLATVFNIPIPEIGKLGDAINYLDDNAIAKGTDIIDVMRRVGGTAQQVGLGAPKVAALASTFLTLGSSAEVAATASNALIRELAIAEQQPKRFQKGLEGLGISAKELQKSMAMDPQGTILGVLDKLNALPKEKQIGITTQLFGKEYGDDIAKLSGGIKEYRRQLELLNDPKLNGSMQREFAIRQQTANAQMQIFKNNIQEVSITFGSALLPMLNRAMAALRPVVMAVVQWIEKNPELSATIGGIAAGLAAFSIAASGVSFLVGGIAKGVELLSFGFKYLSQGVGMVIKVFNFLRIVMMANPVIAIITAIAAAAYLIYDNWGTIGPWLAKMWESVKGIFGKAWEWIKSFFLNYSLPGLLIKHWGDISGMLSMFYDAGQNIMNQLWEGIKSLAMKPVDAIRDVVKNMRDYLPFSPAKTGPFKDLHRVKIVETIAQSVKPGPLVKAFGSVARMASDALSPQGGGLSPLAASGGGMTLNFQPQISWSGNVTEQSKTDLMGMLKQYESELVRMVEGAMERKQRAKY